MNSIINTSEERLKEVEERDSIAAFDLKIEESPFEVKDVVEEVVVKEINDVNFFDELCKQVGTKEHQIIKNSMYNMSFTFGSFYDHRGVMQKGKEQNIAFISRCLPDFKPITINRSGIMNEAGIRLISYYLPPLIKMREWRLLFSIDRDGCSF